MARPRNRGPQIDVRRHVAKDGTVSESPTVRYYDFEGVRRRIGFATREEAELARARMVVEGRPEPEPDATPITLAEFWPGWLADARSRLQAATLEDYEYLWRRRLSRRFGELCLDDIKPREVSQWRVAMLAAGVGPETVRKSMILLQAMFTAAIEWGDATANPVSVVRKPRQGPGRAAQVLDPGDVERLRRAMLEAGDQRSATLLVLLAYSGLRPGEALALERRHVRQDTILVEQAVSRGQLKLQKTGRAYRTVDLLEPLRVDLKAWFNLQGIEEQSAPLFARADGTWWTKEDWRNWRSRQFRRSTMALGLGSPRPYDLRHSFVSLLVREQRASIVDIAEQLGHSPTETLKTYAHVMREHRRQTPVAATELIEAARRGTEGRDLLRVGAS